MTGIVGTTGASSGTLGTITTETVSLTGTQTLTNKTISTGSGLATGIHGVYTVEEADHYIYETVTASTTASQNLVNIQGTNKLTITPTATTDKVDFGFRVNVRLGGGGQQYMGLGIERAQATDFGTNQSQVWASGQHTWGAGTNNCVDWYNTFGGSIMRTAAQWGMSAGTTYYFRLNGTTHSPSPGQGYQWGVQGTGIIDAGVEFNYKRWSSV